MRIWSTLSLRRTRRSLTAQLIATAAAAAAARTMNAIIRRWSVHDCRHASTISLKYQITYTTVRLIADIQAYQ